MAQKTKNTRVTLWKSLQPKTRGGKFTVSAIAILCVAGCAYYAGATASRVEDSARSFVQKYENVDQTRYRTKI